jgi:hypothetical protein
MPPLQDTLSTGLSFPPIEIALSSDLFPDEQPGLEPETFALLARSQRSKICSWLLRAKYG